jgi:hypothetical protein
MYKCNAILIAIIVLAGFTISSAGKIKPYMGIFFENEKFQKEGEYVTLYIHISKAPAEVRSIVKILREQLIANGWNPVTDGTAKKLYSEIRIYAGVNLPKYKGGIMKKGGTIAVSAKGKDFIVNTEEKGDREISVSQIIENVNSNL